MTDQPEEDVRSLIVGLRGGVPERCDFCDRETPEHKLHPEEAGDWVCEDCLHRWGDLP